MEKNRLAYYEIHRKTRKLTVVIVRDNGFHSHFQNSKPCIYCQELLVSMKFKKIIYTGDNGSVEIKRTHELDSKHYSRAQMCTMNTISEKKKLPCKKKKKLRE